MLTEESQQQEEEEEDAVVMMKITKIMAIDVVDLTINEAATEIEMKVRMVKIIKLEHVEQEVQQEEENVADTEVIEEANGEEEEVAVDKEEVQEEGIRMTVLMDMSKTFSMDPEVEMTMNQMMMNQAVKRNH